MVLLFCILLMVIILWWCVQKSIFHNLRLRLRCIRNIYRSTIPVLTKHLTTHCFWQELIPSIINIDDSKWFIYVWQVNRSSNLTSQVHKVQWYMLHYGMETPKRLYGYCNSKTVGRLNRGQLIGWSKKKKVLKDAGKSKDLVHRYEDSQGKKRWKGSKDLRGSEWGSEYVLFAVCVCSFKHYGCQLLLKIWSSANVYRI